MGDNDRPQGEFLSIAERLVISPGWGRIRAGAIEAGQQIDQGAEIARLSENGDDVPLVAHCRGAFLGWLVQDGDRVSPGRAVARLLFAEA
ncbi:MAG: hypothetical protein M3273_06270 [Actinomycetota bacterium]|nr:hypothetical protein [Actinomycetota bacterium]